MTNVTGGVAAGVILPVLVLMKSPPASIASHDARRTLSCRELPSLEDDLEMRALLAGASGAGFLHRDDLIEHLAVPAGQEGAAVDHHVDLVGSGDGVASVLHPDLEARPAAWEGCRDTGDLDPARSQCLLRRLDKVRVDADRPPPAGRWVGRVGSERFRAERLDLARRVLPSSVVRSIIEIARSIAVCFAVVLIDRVASVAARNSAPTWSTPGRPYRNRRRDVSAVISDNRAPSIASRTVIFGF